VFDKLKGGQEYSRQECISQLEELLNYVEDAYRQHQCAHEVEEGVFRKVLELGRLVFGLFFRLCGDVDQGERLLLAVVGCANLRINGEQSPTKAVGNKKGAYSPLLVETEFVEAA